MRLEKLSRDDWTIGGVALLTAIDLLFFPWFHFSGHFGAFSVSESLSGTSSPDGFLGVLAMLAAIAVLADLAVERLAPQLQVPAISNSRRTTRFILTVVAAAFMALKFLFHIHFGSFGWGFYVGVVLIVALLVLTRRATESVAPAPAATPA